jgi:hypothetical protein
MKKGKSMKKGKRGLKKESFGLTSMQPTILYSRDSNNGLETIKASQTFTSPDDDSITYVSTKTSIMPTREITTPSGITSLSGREKRAMVIQYYTNMQPTKLKKIRKHTKKTMKKTMKKTTKKTMKKH